MPDVHNLVEGLQGVEVYRDHHGDTMEVLGGHASQTSYQFVMCVQKRDLLMHDA